MKTSSKKTEGSKNIPAKKGNDEKISIDEKTAMEQLISDKTGDDQKVSKQMNNMGLAVNKNTKKTEKLTSKHTFAHSKVDRSRYITKK